MHWVYMYVCLGLSRGIQIHPDNSFTAGGERVLHDDA